MANSRLKYGNNYFEFDRKLNVFESVDEQLRAQFTSLSGVKEFLNFATKRRLRIGRELSNPGEVSGLRSFWEYAKDGSAFTFERDPELGIYLNCDGEVYSNDGISYTYNGNSEQLYWTSNQFEQRNTFTQNTLVSQTDGTKPRFVNDTVKGYKKGLLLEGSGTNEILYSEDFNNAAWTKTGVTVAANNTDIESPVGGYIADRMHGSGTIEQSAGALSGTQVSASVYAYDVAGHDVNIKIKSSIDGILATSAGFLAVTTGWRRIYVSYSGSLAGNISIVIENTNASSNVILWGAQLEKRYTPSSYMKSEGTSGTRTGEYIKFPLSTDYFDQDGDRYNSFSFWIYPYFGGSDQNTQIIFTIKNDTTGRYFFYFDHSYSGIGVWEGHGIKYDGSSAFNNVQSSSLSTDFDMIHIFIQLHHANAGNVIKFYINGTLLTGTSSNTFTDYAPADLPDTLYIGSPSPSFTANMVLSEFTSYRGKEFTQTEITELAAATLQQGHAANRYEDLTLVNTDFIDKCNPGTELKGFELEFEKV